jgi:hypothetical protein
MMVNDGLFMDKLWLMMFFFYWRNYGQWWRMVDYQWLMVGIHYVKYHVGNTMPLMNG